MKKIPLENGSKMKQMVERVVSKSERVGSKSERALSKLIKAREKRQKLLQKSKSQEKSDDDPIFPPPDDLKPGLEHYINPYIKNITSSFEQDMPSKNLLDRNLNHVWCSNQKTAWIKLEFYDKWKPCVVRLHFWDVCLSQNITLETYLKTIVSENAFGTLSGSANFDLEHPQPDTDEMDGKPISIDGKYNTMVTLPVDLSAGHSMMIRLDKALRKDKIHCRYGHALRFIEIYARRGRKLVDYMAKVTFALKMDKINRFVQASEGERAALLTVQGRIAKMIQMREEAEKKARSFPTWNDLVILGKKKKTGLDFMQVELKARSSFSRMKEKPKDFIIKEEGWRDRKRKQAKSLRELFEKESPNLRTHCARDFLPEHLRPGYEKKKKNERNDAFEQLDFVECQYQQLKPRPHTASTRPQSSAYYTVNSTRASTPSPDKIRLNSEKKKSHTKMQAEKKKKELPMHVDGGLGEGWEEYTAKNGALYYHNIITSQTTWSRPTKSNPLPKGWVSYVDLNSQKTYYHNIVTDETSWDRPRRSAFRVSASLSDDDEDEFDEDVGIWEQKMKPDGTMYYVNQRLDMVKLEPPPEFQMFGNRSQTDPSVVTYTKSITDGPVTDRNDNNNLLLPQNWSKHITVDDGHEETYYLNRETGETTWTHPATTIPVR